MLDAAGAEWIKPEQLPKLKESKVGLSITQLTLALRLCRAASGVHGQERWRIVRPGRLLCQSDQLSKCFLRASE